MQNEIRTQSLHQDWIHRTAIYEFNEYIESKFAKVIMGIRRSGKSTMAILGLKGKSFLYFNFDDEVLAQLNSTELQNLFEIGLSINSNAQYFIFDEIQNIDGWEFFVNKLQRRGYNIIITGSNSRLLSSELSSHLTGRQVSIEILPFSFSEFLYFKKIELNENIEKMGAQKKAIIIACFDEYFQKGGFPELLALPSESMLRKTYLRELYDRILSRDIVQRRKIRNLRSMKEIGLLMMSQFACLFSYQNVRRTTGLTGVSTVKNYIEYIQESYLGFLLEPYSHKVKERISLPKKFYAIDLGLLHAVLGIEGTDLGRKLENLIFLELRRRSQEIYFIKEPNYEVDFVIRKGRKLVKLIQVCWNLDDYATQERELSALIRAAKKYKVSDLEVVTYNFENVENIEGFVVKLTPVWKWLLQVPTS